MANATRETEAATETQKSVHYVGHASIARMSKKDWKAAGVEDAAEDHEWTHEGQIPLDKFTEAQLAVLARDARFKIDK